AVLGTGNIGTDLLLKLLRRSQLEVAVFAGVDPASAGIARAQSLGVRTSTDGIDAVLADDDVRLVFDASSAGAHRRHAPLLEDAGKLTVDLTPAPAGPPILMGNTVMAIPESPDVDEQEVRDAVDRMVAEVAHYVPGYRLKAPVAFDEQDTPWGRATVIVVLLQVEGAGDFLPRYAGNLDIMTS